jgi:hypothetical protein
MESMEIPSYSSHFNNWSTDARKELEDYICDRFGVTKSGDNTVAWNGGTSVVTTEPNVNGCSISITGTTKDEAEQIFEHLHDKFDNR